MFYILYSIVYILYSIFYTVYSILCIIEPTVYSPHYIFYVLYIRSSTFYILDSMCDIIHAHAIFYIIYYIL